MSKFDTHGGYFAPKDYLRVNEGGSHEENPNGGVQIGVDPEGTPNLLEEGEPVYKDYVYSDNIEAEKEFLEQNHLPGKYAGKLYSKIADDLFSEAEERPLDPISRNGLEALLGRLADAQEGQKQAKEQRDLEDELANLSPEELDQLEAMLAQGEEQPIVGEDMYSDPGVNGPDGEQGPVEPTLQMPYATQPMMAEGGPINKYGGKSKKTGFLRRILSSPVRVPAMTGTATAAPGFLSSIPTTESTVGREALVGGTALAAPFISGVGMAAATNPFVQTAVDTYFTVDGVRNAMSDNGVAKTVRLVEQAIQADDEKERNRLIWDAVKSGAVDAMDIAGAVRLVRDASKVGKAIYSGANGVALSSDQIAERLAKAERAAKDAKEAEESVRKATEKTAPLLKQLEKADRKKAELMRYSGTKTKAVERAQSRLDDVDDAIENLVSSQEEALRAGESVPGFDVKLSQYGDVRASRVKSLEKAKNEADIVNDALDDQIYQFNRLESKYDDVVDKAGISNEFKATTPSEAKRRNVIQTMFNPFYRGLRSYDIHEDVGRSLGAMYGQVPIIFGSYAVPGVALGFGIENALSNRGESASDQQEEFDPTLLEIGEWSSTPFVETDPLLEQHTTYENGVPVQTDTTYRSREFGGKINRFDEGGDAYRRFMKLLTDYGVSKNRGGIEGMYRIDRNFDPYLRGNKNLGALEHDPRYVAFTDLVKKKAAEGNRRALMYLSQLDNGVADWTDRLFDQNGNLRNGWEAIYDDRRYDGDAGIYHLIPEFNDVKELDGFFDDPQAIQPSNVDGPGANPYDWYRRRAYNILGAVNPQTMIMARALEDKNVPGQLAGRMAVDVSPISSSGSGTGTGSAQQSSGPLPVWPRYAGAVGSGLLGLYNAFQSPDRYTATRINPQVPEGRINLQNQVYNPVDQNMVMNAQIAQGNATNRALRNSGLGPSSAAAILAADNNTTGNLGTGFLQTWDANNQRRNAIIAANNQAEAQRANFDYTVDAARKEAFNRFAPYNAQNDLMVQRLNNQAEADKYTAISNQISNGLQALSGIGQENFAMNQVNTNPAYLGYRVGPNGAMFYNPNTGKWEKVKS